MRYTQQQVREAVGLTQETFRHWRKALTGLGGKTGHSPQFSYGDLVALRVIRELVDSHGFAVGRLAEVAPDLFKVCNNTPWAGIGELHLVIADGNVRLIDRDTLPTLDWSALTIVVPCHMITEALRASILSGGAPEQSQLPFPPFALKQSQSVKKT